ncbi:MAG TPA: MFS transporter [Vicinamibacterales bacterium]|nr:MFS transporter [Vicinamibacterales bacterium]
MKRFGLHSTVWATASTHFVVDAYGNMYAPLLPLLIPQLGLSLKTVGVLAMCYQLASSVSQLGFGTLADRWRPRVLLMAGPILSVVVLSAIGTASSVPMLAALLLIGGLGGAAFHPPAAALVHSVAGERKGLAMSTHISGGSLGFALAPLVFAPAILMLGPSRAWLVAIPGLFALTYTLRLIRRVPIPTRSQGQSWSDLRPYAKPLGLLYIIVVLRTLTANSLSVFLPVLLTRQGMGVGEASAAVSFYLFISTVGGFLGGPLSDSYGARRVMIWTLSASVPFLLAGQMTSGWTLAVLTSVGGFLLQSTLPVNVTFGQQIAPVSAATVSSLMMGFAWGVGSLLAPVVGVIGDALGLNVALSITAVVPLLAALFALPLPRTVPGAVGPVPGGLPSALGPEA